MAIRYRNIYCWVCNKDRRRTSYLHFASPFCRSCAIKFRWMRDGNPPLKCKRCRKLFPFRQSGGRPRVYCSRACRVTAITKQCNVCGASFAVPPSNAKRYLRCSAACREQVAFSTTSICRTCGSPFTHSGADKRRRHCSIPCYRRSTAETNIEERTRLILESLAVPYVQEFAIGRDVFDFYLPLKHLLIECDGDYWHRRTQERDLAKQERGVANGYGVLRFTETDIMAETFPKQLKRAIA